MAVVQTWKADLLVRPASVMARSEPSARRVAIPGAWELRISPWDLPSDLQADEAVRRSSENLDLPDDLSKGGKGVFEI